MLSHVTRLLYIWCVLYALFFHVECEDGKPHFQIDHQAGELDISATPSSADILFGNDNIDLLLKPGESEEPVIRKVLASKHEIPDNSTQNSEESKVDNKFESKYDMQSNKTDNTTLRANIDAKNSSNITTLELGSHNQTLANNTQNETSNITWKGRLNHTDDHATSSVLKTLDEIKKLMSQSQSKTDESSRFSNTDTQGQQRDEYLDAANAIIEKVEQQQGSSVSNFTENNPEDIDYVKKAQAILNRYKQLEAKNNTDNFTDDRIDGRNSLAKYDITGLTNNSSDSFPVLRLPPIHNQTKNGLSNKSFSIVPVKTQRVSYELDKIMKRVSPRLYQAKSIRLPLTNENSTQSELDPELAPNIKGNSTKLNEEVTVHNVNTTGDITFNQTYGKISKKNVSQIVNNNNNNTATENTTTSSSEENAKSREHNGKSTPEYHFEFDNAKHTPKSHTSTKDGGVLDLTSSTAEKAYASIDMDADAVREKLKKLQEEERQNHEERPAEKKNPKEEDVYATIDNNLTRNITKEEMENNDNESNKTSDGDSEKELTKYVYHDKEEEEKQLHENHMKKLVAWAPVRQNGKDDTESNLSSEMRHVSHHKKDENNEDEHVSIHDEKANEFFKTQEEMELAKCRDDTNCQKKSGMDMNNDKQKDIEEVKQEAKLENVTIANDANETKDALDHAKKLANDVAKEINKTQHHEMKFSHSENESTDEDKSHHNEHNTSGGDDELKKIRKEEAELSQEDKQKLESEKDWSIEALNKTESSPSQSTGDKSRTKAEEGKKLSKNDEMKSETNTTKESGDKAKSNSQADEEKESILAKLDQNPSPERPDNRHEVNHMTDQKSENIHDKQIERHDSNGGETQSWESKDTTVAVGVGNQVSKQPEEEQKHELSSKDRADEKEEHKKLDDLEMKERLKSHQEKETQEKKLKNDHVEEKRNATVNHHLEEARGHSSDYHNIEKHEPTMIDETAKLLEDDKEKLPEKSVSSFLLNGEEESVEETYGSLREKYNEGGSKIPMNNFASKQSNEEFRDDDEDSDYEEANHTEDKKKKELHAEDEDSHQASANKYKEKDLEGMITLERQDSERTSTGHMKKKHFKKKRKIRKKQKFTSRKAKNKQQYTGKKKHLAVQAQFEKKRKQKTKEDIQKKKDKLFSFTPKEATDAENVLKTLDETGKQSSTPVKNVASVTINAPGSNIEAEKKPKLLPQPQLQQYVHPQAFSTQQTIAQTANSTQNTAPLQTATPAQTQIAAVPVQPENQGEQSQVSQTQDMEPTVTLDVQNKDDPETKINETTADVFPEVKENSSLSEQLNKPKQHEFDFAQIDPDIVTENHLDLGAAKPALGLFPADVRKKLKDMNLDGPSSQKIEQLRKERKIQFLLEQHVKQKKPAKGMNKAQTKNEAKEALKKLEEANSEQRDSKTGSSEQSSTNNLTDDVSKAMEELEALMKEKTDEVNKSTKSNHEKTGESSLEHQTAENVLKELNKGETEKHSSPNLQFIDPQHMKSLEDDPTKALALFRRNSTDADENEFDSNDDKYEKEAQATAQHKAIITRYRSHKKAKHHKKNVDKKKSIPSEKNIEDVLNEANHFKLEEEVKLNQAKVSDDKNQEHFVEHVLTKYTQATELLKKRLKELRAKSKAKIQTNNEFPDDEAVQGLQSTGENKTVDANLTQSTNLTQNTSNALNTTNGIDSNPSTEDVSQTTQTSQTTQNTTEDNGEQPLTNYLVGNTGDEFDIKETSADAYNNKDHNVTTTTDAELLSPNTAGTASVKNISVVSGTNDTPNSSSTTVNQSTTTATTTTDSEKEDSDVNEVNKEIDSMSDEINRMEKQKAKETSLSWKDDGLEKQKVKDTTLSWKDDGMETLNTTSHNETTQGNSIANETTPFSIESNKNMSVRKVDDSKSAEGLKPESIDNSTKTTEEMNESVDSSKAQSNQNNNDSVKTVEGTMTSSDQEQTHTEGQTSDLSMNQTTVADQQESSAVTSQTQTAPLGNSQLTETYQTASSSGQEPANIPMVAATSQNENTDRNIEQSTERQSQQFSGQDTKSESSGTESESLDTNSEFSDSKPESSVAKPESSEGTNSKTDTSPVSIKEKSSKEVTATTNQDNKSSDKENVQEKNKNKNKTKRDSKKDKKIKKEEKFKEKSKTRERYEIKEGSTLEAGQQNVDGGIDKSDQTIISQLSSGKTEKPNELIQEIKADFDQQEQMSEDMKEYNEQEKKAAEKALEDMNKLAQGGDYIEKEPHHEHADEPKQESNTLNEQEIKQRLEAEQISPKETNSNLIKDEGHGSKGKPEVEEKHLDGEHESKVEEQQADGGVIANQYHSKENGHPEEENVHPTEGIIPNKHYKKDTGHTQKTETDGQTPNLEETIVNQEKHESESQEEKDDSVSHKQNEAVHKNNNNTNNNNNNNINNNKEENTKLRDEDKNKSEDLFNLEALAKHFKNNDLENLFGNSTSTDSSSDEKVLEAATNAILNSSSLIKDIKNSPDTKAKTNSFHETTIDPYSTFKRSFIKLRKRKHSQHIT